MNAYEIIRAFGVVVLLSAAAVQCSQIHEQMTDDEIANIFHTTRDEIPKYVVAPVWHNRYKRADQNLRVHFTAFGKVMDSYLQPSDGQLMGANTPIWFAFTKPDGTVEYKKTAEGIVGRMTSRFFTDHSNFSAITVNQMKGKKPSFYGILGDLIIRPLPRRLQEEARSRRNSEATNASRTMLDTHDHVIIKSTSGAEPEGLERKIHETYGDVIDASRVKRSNQEIIYPSVLIHTDYNRTMTTLDEADHYDEIIYQLAFWTGVDLLFRHVNDPKIRIRIAGIIIGLGRDATPYMRKNLATYQERFAEVKNYWYKMSQREEFPVEAYDVVMTITDADISGDGVTACASGSLCTPTWNNKYHAVGVAQDAGGFKGIRLATFALAVSFGVHADPEDGDECNSANGFIMQKKHVSSPNNLKWSPCTLRDFTAVLRRSYINCADEPAEFYPPGQPVQILLPGDVSTLHEQCQGRGYDAACEPSPDMCAQMRCYYEGWHASIWGWWCKYSVPAAEGTPCAPGHKCVDGVCQCVTADCMFCSVNPEEETNP